MGGVSLNSLMNEGRKSPPVLCDLSTSDPSPFNMGVGKTCLRELYRVNARIRKLKL